MFHVAKTTVAVAISAVSLAGSTLAQSEWNRRVGAVHTRPHAAAPELHTLWAEWTFDLYAVNATILNLGAELEILINGEPVATQDFGVIVLPGGGFGCQGQQGNCGGNCGNWSGDGLANDLYCRPDADLDCNCGPLWITSDPGPGVELKPGDEITVILYPAPGAAPEGQTADDIQVSVFIPCPGDLNGDMSVGIEDLALLLSNFGAQDADYLDGDLNLDGVVDITDVSLLLAAYGARC